MVSTIPFKAVCIDDGGSENLKKGEQYWIRFVSDKYVYATRIHIKSDKGHFGMFQASRFEIVEVTTISEVDENETFNYEQLSLF